MSREACLCPGPMTGKSSDAACRPSHRSKLGRRKRVRSRSGHSSVARPDELECDRAGQSGACSRDRSKHRRKDRRNRRTARACHKRARSRRAHCKLVRSKPVHRNGAGTGGLGCDPRGGACSKAHNKARNKSLARRTLAPRHNNPPWRRWPGLSTRGRPSTRKRKLDSSWEGSLFPKRWKDRTPTSYVASPPSSFSDSGDRGGVSFRQTWQTEMQAIPLASWVPIGIQAPRS